MELYQLRSFVAVARNGNLTRAAEDLNTSQPAVSAQIKALEEELGIALFSRTPKGMELTEAGKLVREKAEAVTREASSLVALAHELRGEVRGCLSIGLNTEADLLRIPQMVAAVSAAAPALRLELVHRVSRSVLKEVARATLDGGFVFGACDTPDLAALTLARLPLVIVAPASWEKRLRGASVDALLREPWVWPPPECPFYEDAAALFQAAGVPAPAGITADHESTVVGLVRAEVGLSLLPEGLVGGGEGRGVIPLRRTESPVKLSFLYRATDGQEPRMRVVLEALGQVWPA